jgi:hypothetical protein
MDNSPAPLTRLIRANMGRIIQLVGVLMIFFAAALLTGTRDATRDIEAELAFGFGILAFALGVIAHQAIRIGKSRSPD